MADAVVRARAIIEKRLSELAKEEQRLRRALQALGQRVGSKAADGAARPRQTRAPRGQRQQEFLAAVRNGPERPVAEIAREMGVHQQQLYPLAQRLVEEGKVQKRGRGYVVIGEQGSRES